MTDAVISLLKETHQVDSEGVDHTIITSRAVMCGLKSVSRTDFYSAGQEGLALGNSAPAPQGLCTGRSDRLF